MKLTRRDFIRACLSATGSIIAGNALVIAEPWLVEEIDIVDVQLDDGWLKVVKTEVSSPPTITMSMDAVALRQCTRLIDQNGDTWRILGEWDGLVRERDGVEVWLTDEGAA